MNLRTRGQLTIRAPLPTLEREDLEKIARALGVEYVRIVRLRTGAGLDERREPFRPYSAEYARRRRLSGRSTDPRLQLTGQMLNGLAVLSVDGGTATVGFGPKTDTVVRFRRIRTKTGAKSSRKLPARAGERATWTLVKLNQTITAVQKAGYVEEKGRRFFGIENDADRRQLAAVAMHRIHQVMQRRR